MFFENNMKDYLNFVDENLKNSEQTSFAKLNENNFYKPNNVIEIFWDTPKNYLIDVFKKWTIKIILKEGKIIPRIYYGEDNFDDKYYEKYNNDNKAYIKKFNGYKKFLNDAIEYIKKEINNIKIRANIILEIKPDIQNNQKYKDEDFYNFQNIECISFLEGEIPKFFDRNILVNGILGKGNGFISLIEELCDYSQETE